MAKGIRSKIKRFWRTKWRKEIGAPVADARAAKAAEIMARSMALQAGASSARRLAICGRGVRGSAVQARAGMPGCVGCTVSVWAVLAMLPMRHWHHVSAHLSGHLPVHLSAVFAPPPSPLLCRYPTSHAARANQPDAPGLTCRPSLVGTHPSVHALRSVTCPKPLREPMHRLLTLASCLLPLASCLLPLCLLPLVSSLLPLASCLFASCLFCLLPPACLPLASHTPPFPRVPLLSSPLLCRFSSLPSAPHLPLYSSGRRQPRGSWRGPQRRRSPGAGGDCDPAHR